MKIVLIEDDEFLLDMYAHKFKEVGFEVKTILSPNLESAVSDVEDFMPDVIITDNLMPDVRGVEIVHSLNKNLKTKYIPIFILDNWTKTSLKADAKKYNPCNYVEYLVKADFTPNEIVKTIKDYLDNPKGYVSPYNHKEDSKKPINSDRYLTLKEIVKTLLYIVMGTIYMVGLVGTPTWFKALIENDTYTSIFISVYLFLGLFLVYYINGIDRRKTKSFKVIYKKDYEDIKNWVKAFIEGIVILIKGLSIVAIWLLKVLGIVVLIGLGIWLVVALGPLWIIAILLFILVFRFV